MTRSTWVTQLVLLSTLLFIVPGVQMGSIGYMTPRKADYKVGDDIRLICNLYSEDNDSRYLDFSRNGVPVSAESVTRVNETAIEMVVRNATAMYSLITCKLNKTIGVDFVELWVGYAPIPVTDFRCISNNWQSLNCTFNYTENPISTHYSLDYLRMSSAFTKSQTLAPYRNATIPDYWFQLEVYTEVTEEYLFTVYQRNVFGALSQNFTVNNFKSLRPAPVENLNVTQAAGKPVNVTWRNSYHLSAYNQVVNGNIIAELNYTTTPSGPWTTLRYFFVSDNCNVTLYNLSAYTWYDFRVRIRMSESYADRDDLWSDYKVFVFQTAARIPDKPPDTDIGAFWASELNDVWIYWRLLPVNERNGDKSGYVISKSRVGGKDMGVHPVVFGVTSAKMVQMRDEPLEFELRSRNAEGQSVEASRIFVPRARDRVAPPRELKKNLNGTTYTLSWKQPAHDANKIVSYTVFWCKSKSEGPNQCEQSIDFRRVNGSVREFTINTTDGVNFAVSANTRNSSSGMVWALCTASESDAIGKLKTIWTPTITSTSMEIQWNLECVDRPILREYNISYCPITAPKNLTCKEGTEMTRLLSSGETRYTITELKPYTTYRTTITMISDTRSGPPSDPRVNTTYEARPSEPLNLMIFDVQNTSVLLRWNAPENLNGVLKNYEIAYNSYRKEVYEDILGHNNMTFRLENLTAFTKYEIAVRACSQCCNCSESSNNVTVTTAIGRPGIVDTQQVNDGPKKRVFFSWSPPALRAGNLDFYEIEVNYTGVQKVTLSRTRQLKCYLNVDTTMDATGLETEQRWQVRIRAVNVVWSGHAKHFGLDGGIGDVLAMKDIEKQKIIELSSSEEDVMTVRATTTTAAPYEFEGDSCTSEELDFEERLISIDKHYQVLAGPWSKAYTHVTSTSSFVWKPAAAIVVLLTVVVAAFVYGYKKFFKLKKGSVVLPPGLTDIAEKPHQDGKLGGGGGASGPGGIMGGGVGERDLVITPDSIGNHARLGMCSDTMYDVKSSSCSNSSATPIAFDSRQAGCGVGSGGADLNMQRSESSSLHEQERRLLEDRTDTQSNASSSIMEHEEGPMLPDCGPLEDEDEVEQPHRVGPNSLEHEILAEMVLKQLSAKQQPELHQLHQPHNQHHPQLPPVLSQTVIKPATNGYVTIAQRSDGYTKLGDLMKPMPTAPEDKGITGYVTHKQLADFGQRMQ